MAIAKVSPLTLYKSPKEHKEERNGNCGSSKGA